MALVTARLSAFILPQGFHLRAQPQSGKYIPKQVICLPNVLVARINTRHQDSTVQTIKRYRRL